jgi:hypothetical protein
VEAARLSEQAAALEIDRKQLSDKIHADLVKTKPTIAPPSTTVAPTSPTIAPPSTINNNNNNNGNETGYKPARSVAQAAKAFETPVCYIQACRQRKT